MTQLDLLIGDSTKDGTGLGWGAKYTLEEMVAGSLLAERNKKFMHRICKSDKFIII